mmetsp:Transcript_43304/g.92694  ORF Transcript_43304/g.92694 Transcript_43304/m.92694 type:complete len:247 (-) Transcript_43304:139-879(-)|eukprot:CAMPEP_0206456074 /NCGR_PEP_ID=MMETSP0324_2-20121206/22151_1 /ASSEMBLY_ACC=CAM_ASM_000836 /TAXON_ID=2866 /ORGANISM="Crypthecodinium cohnii, Strain Seligo" /LENGTH=246 /DNA_ID=CAMNT_0053926939 /DNA_START=153 /DNA_END=893 /DNA_ORIENTATION=+
MFACCCAAPQETTAAQVYQIPTLEEHEPPTVKAPPPPPPPAEAYKAPEPKKEPEPKTQAAPPAAPADTKAKVPKNVFTVVLHKDKSRPKGPLGWRLDCVAKSVLYVFEVSSDSTTPIWNYNASAPVDERIRVGDFISAVNTYSDSEQMTAAIENDERLEFIVKRPISKTVTVEKKGQPLGLELKYWQAGTTLMVGAIAQGAVKNARVDVQPGDRILSVNGTTGSSDTLLASLRASDTLELTMARCP